MIKIYDIKCTNCGAVWEHLFKDHTHMTNPECPWCHFNFTVRLPGGLKRHKAKDPYDYLDKGPDYGKKIFSGPKVHSK